MGCEQWKNITGGKKKSKPHQPRQPGFRILSSDLRILNWAGTGTCRYTTPRFRLNTPTRRIAVNRITTPPVTITAHQLTTRERAHIA